MTYLEIMSDPKTEFLLIKSDNITQKFANDLMREWMTVLGLENWDIVLKINCSPEEMDEQEATGVNVFNETLKASIIKILDPKFYSSNLSLPFNFEKTLIHELLHLNFALLDESDNELQNRIVHQMVDDMAKALWISKYFQKSER